MSAEREIWLVDGVRVRWWQAWGGACLEDGRLCGYWPLRVCSRCGGLDALGKDRNGNALCLNPAMCKERAMARRFEMSRRRR